MRVRSLALGAALCAGLIGFTVGAVQPKAAARALALETPPPASSQQLSDYGHLGWRGLKARTARPPQRSQAFPLLRGRVGLARSAPCSGTACLPEPFEAGLLAYFDGDYGRAYEVWRRHAALGHGLAQRNMGHLLRLGLGVAPDPSRAAGYFRSAAQRGFVSAQLRYAQMCRTGEGRMRDPALAATWFSRAAAGGNTEALYSLAQMHEWGEGVRRDPVLAQTYYARAAEAGNPRARDALTRLAARGPNELITGIASSPAAPRTRVVDPIGPPRPSTRIAPPPQVRTGPLPGPAPSMTPFARRTTQSLRQSGAMMLRPALSANQSLPEMRRPVRTAPQDRYAQASAQRLKRFIPRAGERTASAAQNTRTASPLAAALEPGTAQKMPEKDLMVLYGGTQVDRYLLERGGQMP